MANSLVIGSSGRVPARTAGPAPTPPGLLLRLRTWLRRPWLDGAIARGVSRAGDRAFALRQAQLIERRERTGLAVRLEDVLTAPSRSSAGSSAAPLDREAVDAARPILTELVLSLRSSEAVDAQGVALGWRLLTDPTSPIYGPPRDESAPGDWLWRESLSVLLALRPLVPVSSSTPP